MGPAQTILERTSAQSEVLSLVHNGVMRQTLTTAEAAWIYRIDSRSFHRWATALGVNPIRRQRRGNAGSNPVRPETAPLAFVADGAVSA